MKKLAFILLLGLGLSAQAVSAKPFFSCQTKNGKTLSLSQVGDQYEYQFLGKDGKPELVFKNKINDVFARDDTQSVGMKNVHFTFEMVNGVYHYNITTSLWDEEGDNGVDVYKNGKTLASVKCASNKISNDTDYLVKVFSHYGKL